ncbi:hypothetical protein [uncultured Acinetobacter sp.]|uniref:hypothetical protein n=1 Tax=uncultured Acinetobacter sp. TaxID=165433 RepID=UPI0025E21BCD|nr:hypothetical protein [uncultured Acinetobacter sp.]
MKSKIGISLCILYIFATLFCLYIALDPMTDNKGNFVFLQLPIVTQLAALDFLGLEPILVKLNWVMAYVLIIPLTLFFLYGVGWIVSHCIQSVKARFVRLNKFKNI